MSNRPKKYKPNPAQNLPRPYRLAVPLEVVPKIDELRLAGHKFTVIGKHLGISPQTIRAVWHRRGAYGSIPKEMQSESE